jgi:catechol 2,3-dioxygenase-like lactoylglutathione lyase family enzyme
MLRIGSIVLGVSDLERAKTFWMAAIDYEPRELDGDTTWSVLVPKSGIGSQLALQVSESPLQEHPRLHLDLYATDQKFEINRLLEIGAKEVTWDLYPADTDFVVLQDPDGNKFCVVQKESVWNGFR